MSKYLVKEPLNHDQKDYAPGATVELNEEQADALILLGVIGEAIGEPDKRLNATETIALVNTIQEPVELDNLVADNQDRKSVLAAIEKRRKELAG